MKSVTRAMVVLVAMGMLAGAAGAAEAVNQAKEIRTVMPGRMVCSQKCLQALRLAGSAVAKCGGCDGTCNAAAAYCTKCAKRLGVCEVCGRKMGVEAPVTGQKAVVAGANRFAVDLYRQISGEGGNLFFSPSSVHTALAMTYAGSGGNTAAEMAKTLHYGQGKEFFAGYGGVLGKTNPGKGAKYELSIANALWLQKGGTFLEPFVACNRDHFKAGLFDLDFARQPEPSRVRINEWVAEQTKQKIKDLLPPQSITFLTRMVLTNAVYFKGDWASQFDKTATREMDFHLSADKKVKVQMMYQKGKFSHAQTLDAQILSLPYAGGDLSMVLVLPRTADGLARLEKSLTAKLVDGWLGQLRRPVDVQVYLPRFKMDYKMQMKPVLSKMGMPEAFSDAADFSGMTGKKDLYISEVFHKAFVQVDEKGTEAAAATGVVMNLKSIGPSRPLVFKADHPFLFAIRHEKTGMILFMGRVAQPRE